MVRQGANLIVSVNFYFLIQVSGFCDLAGDGN